MALVSKETDYIKYRGHNFPFSYSTALFCIKRLLQRKEHSTLTCEDEVKAVHVLVFFMKLYQNFVPKLYNVGKQGIEGIIEVPFTPALPSIPEDLLTAFQQVLEHTCKLETIIFSNKSRGLHKARSCEDTNWID